MYCLICEDRVTGVDVPTDPAQPAVYTPCGHRVDRETGLVVAAAL